MWNIIFFTDTENKLMATKRECGDREINQELGMNTYTLLYIQQITNKDLLYSTENFTQYFVITYIKSKKE